ncbi:hypothetical protein V6N13_116145 [Hibiscus sabdariffa]
MGPSVSGGQINMDSSMIIDEEDVPIDQVEGVKRPRNLATSPVVYHNTDLNGATLFILADLQDQMAVSFLEMPQLGAPPFYKICYVSIPVVPTK